MTVEDDGGTMTAGIALWRVFERARRRVGSAYRMRALRRRVHFPVAPIRRPIFLVGTVRSGTTFFARCLGDHPAVVYAGFELLPEWVELAGVEIAGPGVPCRECRSDDGGGRDEAELAAIRRRFAALHADKGGWRFSRFFNKNPHLWNKLGLVRRLFPDASFVVTSRDLRSTVASTKRLWERMRADWGVVHSLPEDPETCWSCAPAEQALTFDPVRTFPGGDVAVLAEYWLRVYERLDAELAPAPRVSVLRHADFVADPAGVLARVLAELELRPFAYPLPDSVQRDRNQRWRELLDAGEQVSLDRFVAANAGRIAGLMLAERAVDP